MKVRKDYSNGLYLSLAIIKEDGKYWIAEPTKRTSESRVTVEESDGTNSSFSLKTAIEKLHTTARVMFLGSDEQAARVESVVEPVEEQKTAEQDAQRIVEIAERTDSIYGLEPGVYHIYGSPMRPMSAAWARIPDALFVNANVATEGVYTWVVTPHVLDEKTVASFELEHRYGPVNYKQEQLSQDVLAATVPDSLFPSDVAYTLIPTSWESDTNYPYNWQVKMLGASMPDNRLYADDDEAHQAVKAAQPNAVYIEQDTFDALVSTSVEMIERNKQVARDVFTALLGEDTDLSFLDDEDVTVEVRISEPDSTKEQERLRLENVMQEASHEGDYATWYDANEAMRDLLGVEDTHPTHELPSWVYGPDEQERHTISHAPQQQQSDLFKQDDFRTMYALALSQGDKRFGSPCRHERVKQGQCVRCLRKVK